MKLTPIKIRGRRGRKQPWQPPNPERFKRPHPDGDDEEFNGETGIVPSQVDQHGVRRRRRVKTRKPAAPIEQLPPEILERIFSMSENLNFPRSSLRIGYILSARTFLLQLIVDAFAPTWDMWFGCPKKDIQTYRGYEKDDERMPGNPEFQVSMPRFECLDMAYEQYCLNIVYARSSLFTYSPSSPPFPPYSSRNPHKLTHPTRPPSSPPNGSPSLSSFTPNKYGSGVTTLPHRIRVPSSTPRTGSCSAAPSAQNSIVTCF